MKYTFKFNRILSLKEREREEAVSVYEEAVAKFEEVAKKLYELLRQKENLEAYQTNRLQEGLPVQEIRYHQQFLENLEKTINHYQKMVINARNRMNLFQEKLMEKNIEVKKYEKIRENDWLYFVEQEKLADNKQMDDISIQHYVNHGN